MIITMKKNKPEKVKEKGTLSDGIMRVTPVSTIHTEVYVNDAPWKLLHQGKSL